MKAKNAFKKINTHFAIHFSLAILAIFLTFSIFYNSFTNIDNDVLFFVVFLFINSIIPIFVYIFTNKNFLLVMGISFFSISTFLTLLINDFSEKPFFLCFTVFLIKSFFSYAVFVLIVRRVKISNLKLFLETVEKEKRLLFEIKKLLPLGDDANTLWDFMTICEKIERNIKAYKEIENSQQNKDLLFSCVNGFLDKKQNRIKNLMIKHYEIIVSNLETKNTGLLMNSYKSSKSLQYAIRKYNYCFDENNKQLSLFLFEKSSLIISFARRYLFEYKEFYNQDIDFMEGHDFEQYCANLLSSLGYTNVYVTRGSGDQGVDIVCQYDNIKFAVQCKRYSKKIGNSPVQEVVAGKKYYGCDCAVVMTNSSFTDSAISLAKANDVILIDGDELKKLSSVIDDEWNKLLNKIKIKFPETNANTGNCENKKWRCSKCGLYVLEEYNYCPFCAYIKNSDYKNN